jgi:thiol-disulfide isomerase/thioredoxin
VVIRLLALAGLLLAAPLEAQKIRPGAAAPEIELTKLQGGKLKLSSLRGHPVVVTFWGTWCPPCRDEFPALVTAHRKYRDAGLEIVAVNQRDQELSTRDVQAFSDRYGVTFPVLLDSRGRSRRSFQLFGLPTTVFIDRSGIIQFVQTGALSSAGLARGLATILPVR